MNGDDSGAIGLVVVMVVVVHMYREGHGHCLGDCHAGDDGTKVHQRKQTVC
jgi:hypothetical protein